MVAEGDKLPLFLPIVDGTADRWQRVLSEYSAYAIASLYCTFFPQFFLIDCGDRLHKTQELLYDSTRDFLTLRYEHRDNEKQWMIEKDRILQQLDACHEQLNIDRQRRNGPSDILSLSVVDVDGDGTVGPLTRQEEFKVNVSCCWSQFIWFEKSFMHIIWWLHTCTK